MISLQCRLCNTVSHHPDLNGIRKAILTVTLMDTLKVDGSSRAQMLSCGVRGSGRKTKTVGRGKGCYCILGAEAVFCGVMGCLAPDHW